jgi:2-polyprenyl-6-methoxyphenol hydroxylase-like FAD-dependent oxidoreductase
MATASPHPDQAAASESTTCCIAGCGPAGAILGLLLARAGVEVVVLEKHDDFFRDFRGDTIHPSTLEVIEELGLLDEFLALPQRPTPRLQARTDGGTVTVADFAELGVRHPYISFVPQWDFLDMLTDEARRLPTFSLRTGTEVAEVLRSGERVVGVRYRSPDGDGELRATLTVAADGRDSVVRRSAGLVPRRYGAPMDVLWFRLPLAEGDPADSFGRISGRGFVAMINRRDYWQAGYIIAKGSLARLRAEGLPAFRARLAELLPFVADRVGAIATWDDVKMLEVQVDRLRRWHLPGLLCIGDAAHAMSPIGGVGINLAIQDAVAAGNRLAGPLREGRLGERDLARVQWRRWLPTAVTQAFQRIAQRRLLAPMLRGQGLPSVPRPLRPLGRIGSVRRLPARLIGVGVRPEHVRAV